MIYSNILYTYFFGIFISERNIIDMENYLIILKRNISSLMEIINQK